MGITNKKDSLQRSWQNLSMVTVLHTEIRVSTLHAGLQQQRIHSNTQRRSQQAFSNLLSFHAGSLQGEWGSLQIGLTISNHSNSPLQRTAFTIQRTASSFTQQQSLRKLGLAQKRGNVSPAHECVSRSLFSLQRRLSMIHNYQLSTISHNSSTIRS